MPLREHKKQRARQAMVDAAVELFRANGFDATRVRDVAARAGVSEKTFFNYFPTKDAVLREFLFTAMASYGAMLAGGLEADAGARVIGLLRTTTRSLARLVTRDRHFMGRAAGALFTVDEDPELRRRGAEIDRLLVELLRTGQRRGEIRADRDPEQLAEILTGTYHLTILHWLADWYGPQRRHDLEGRLQAALDVLLEGMGGTARARPGPRSSGDGRPRSSLARGAGAAYRREHR